MDFLRDLRSGVGNDSIGKAVGRNDTAAIFDWMMESFSYQGISNRVAESYLVAHGNVRWLDLTGHLAASPACSRLTNYWMYEGCRYDKTSRSCASPEQIDACPVPAHALRNGRLNQTAYSLYFFLRDIAGNDFRGWIDQQLSSVSPDAPDRSNALQRSLIDPMKHIFGVSDKVLTMTLSGLLMAALPARQNWFEAGSGMIAVDTLVHNFLHRTGITDRLGHRHSYGHACYDQGGCAELLRRVSARIDARRFNSANPRDFPRFIQHAIWHYCAIDGQNACNGVNIDDRKSCENIYCIVFNICNKIPIKTCNNVQN